MAKPMAHKQQGHIKKWQDDKGFGFIGVLEQDIFFHISDFPLADGEPKRNERVKFLVEENGDKLKAVRIERVEDNSAKAKKSKVSTHNKAITSDLLSNFRK